MPQDAKQKQKIIALMEKAANIDNTVTAERKSNAGRSKEIIKYL